MSELLDNPTNELTNEPTKINKLILNPSQQKAVNALKKFIASNNNKFLLLGPGGSGKTTCIVNALDGNNEYKIAFCAFTNKATQVLKNTAERFGLKFQADFMTIHKLLMLEPKYFERESEVSFSFDVNKLVGYSQYDIIIFDECSVISKELKTYIYEAQRYALFAHQKANKHIFIGDFWQLPPVGEEKSLIFEASIKEKWPVSKLDKVMRSGNDVIYEVNNSLLNWISKFKAPKEHADELDNFHKKFPYNLLAKNSIGGKYINSLDIFLDEYIELWKTQPSIVILTYSHSSCNKTNWAIQDRIDLEAQRPIPENRDEIKFYVGDRCCVDKPIEVCEIEKRTIDNIEYVTLGNPSGESLYNGEIFDIIMAQDVRIITPLNKFSYITKYFNGQLLKVHRINDPTKIYDILYIDDTVINAARGRIRSHERRMFYLNVFSQFIRYYPKLTYGYCLTVYKSQGSEWNTVLINLISIRYCTIGLTIPDLKKKTALFKTAYTAISRASHNLYLLWR